MPEEAVDIIIAGGGLSGIYAVYLPEQRNISFIVLEARDRIGGRILSPEYRGFFGIPAAQRDRQQLLIEAILSQLSIIYGKKAAQPATFFHKDWACERYSATPYDQPPMYEHPLYYPPAGQTSIWDGTVHFACTETAIEHGGYLEGALGAAERAVMSC